MLIPDEIKSYFSDQNFSGYPFVEVPQSFQDFRGRILNIADGKLGDVALITSTPGSIRANHYHKEDWHLTYVVSGAMKYFWKDNLDDFKKHEVLVSSGQLIFTPTMVPHMMQFSENSTFIAISKLSRQQLMYEHDTEKLEENFFG